MSKIISFFLASSITDMQEDRRAVGDFINQINNIYQPLDIFVKLYKCEDESMDHSVILGGTQKSLNELIRESDLCFVIFWRKVGEITEQELKIAYEAFKEKNRPKIVVYFKSLDDGSSIPEDIKRVMKMIDDEMLHYHREYSHIDSLMLGIITQLQVHGFIKEELKVNHDKITISGQSIVSTKELPLFSQNDEYCDLIVRFKEADELCAKLLQQYNENKNNARIYREYMKQVKVRDRIKEDMDEMAEDILKIGKRIAQLALDSAMTERIQKAIKFFDVGDYQSVLDILSPEELDKQSSELDMAEEQILMARRSIVEEYRLRILALEAQGKWGEVYEAYQKAISQVEERREMPKAIMLEFSRFLFKQKQYKQSIAICEKLRTNINEIDLGYFNRADLLDLLGELYFTIMRFDDAEAVLNEALEYRESTSGEGFEQDVQKAGTCVILARVLFLVNRHFESEALFLRALDIYKKYNAKHIQSIDANIANVSLELGDLYYMINRHADAANLFLDAGNKYRELVERGETGYSASFAHAYNKVAYLYIAIHRHKLSDRYYIEALKVKQCLAQKDSIAYFEYLQRICEKLGIIWGENGNSENADCILSEAKRIKEGIQQNKYANLEKDKFDSLDEAFYDKPLDKELVEHLCKKSLSLYEALAQENPEAFESSLSQAHDTLGAFYTQIQKKKLAEFHFAEAIKLRKILSQREPSVMLTQLANSYSNLAHFYDINDQSKKAEDYKLKAIDIYASVSQKNAGAYDTDLARNYHELANFYTRIGEENKAEYYYLESIQLYIKLYEKSPRAYVDRIINTIADITMYLIPIESDEWMEQFINF